MRALVMIFTAGLLLTGCVVEPAYGYRHHHTSYYRAAPTTTVVVREQYRRPPHYSHHQHGHYRHGSGHGWGR